MTNIEHNEGIDKTSSFNEILKKSLPNQIYKIEEVLAQINGVELEKQCNIMNNILQAELSKKNIDFSKIFNEKVKNSIGNMEIV